LAGGKTWIHPGFAVPTGDRNIEFERALPKRFDRFDQAPRDRGSCSFAQCFSRHTDKGTRGPRENPLGSSMRAGARCACVTIRPAHSHARIRARVSACEEAGSYAVKSVTKSRGPIAMADPSCLPTASAGSIINL